DDASRARLAVLAGVSRRAGPRGRAAARGLRLRGGLAAPHPAAAVRAAEVGSVIAGRERGSRARNPVLWRCVRILDTALSRDFRNEERRLTTAPHASRRTTPAPPRPPPTCVWLRAFPQARRMSRHPHHPTRRRAHAPWSGGWPPARSRAGGRACARPRR